MEASFLAELHAFNQCLLRIAYGQGVVWVADEHCLDTRLLRREVVCSLERREQVVIVVLIRWSLGDDHVDVSTSFQDWLKAVYAGQPL
jgi:hypothetical protein